MLAQVTLNINYSTLQYFNVNIDSIFVSHLSISILLAYEISNLEGVAGKCNPTLFEIIDIIVAFELIWHIKS